MTLVRWKPFRDFGYLQNRFNQLLQEDMWKEDSSSELARSHWSPSTDIFETKNEFVFKLEVPGMNKDDIEIEFNKDMLTIKGEKKQEKEIKDEDYHRIERCNGSFSRSFNLPKNVDEKKIDASMKDGVLELRLPKMEEAKPKAIPIKIK
jgi:HSP20 family protein